ncbi:unnamed protein product [Closterium sp. Yama58-4]|nr:unnamed protein product [Closterium sp. Yama58-4]
MRCAASAQQAETAGAPLLSYSPSSVAGHRACQSAPLLRPRSLHPSEVVPVNLNPSPSPPPAQSPPAAEESSRATAASSGESRSSNYDSSSCHDLSNSAAAAAAYYDPSQSAAYYNSSFDPRAYRESDTSSLSAAAAAAQQPTPPPPSTHHEAPHASLGDLLSSHHFDCHITLSHRAAVRSRQHHPPAVHISEPPLPYDARKSPRRRAQLRVAELTERREAGGPMSAVNHSNILRLEGVGLDAEEKPILVYGLIPGGDVKNFLARVRGNEARFPWKDHVRVALGCAKALAVIYENMFIHRDFKSSNVLLRKDFTPVLANYGLAHTIEDWKTHVSTAVVGSIEYIDPNYWQTGQICQLADTYAFGVFLLELISSYYPLNGRFKELRKEMTYTDFDPSWVDPTIEGERVAHATSRSQITSEAGKDSADADDCVSSKYAIEDGDREDGNDGDEVDDDAASENLPISLVVAALFLDTKGQSRALIKKLCSFDSDFFHRKLLTLPGVTRTASFVKQGITWLQTHLSVPVMSHADAFSGQSYSADALAKGGRCKRSPCGSCCVSMPKDSHEHGNADYYLPNRARSSKQVLPLVGLGAVAILVLLVRGGVPARTPFHRGIFPFPKLPTGATASVYQSTTAAWLDLTALFFLFFGTAALTRFAIIHLIRRHPHLSLPLAALLPADRGGGGRGSAGRSGCAPGGSVFMRDLCGKAAKMGLGGGFWRAAWWQAQLSPSPRGRRSSAQLAERFSATSGTSKGMSKFGDAVDDALCLTVRRYTNGDKYEGETRDGVASGSGVYYFDEAAGKYEGEWADGKYSGLGVESWESGSVYRGEYKRGYREGRGLYQFHTGDAYAGAWARGQSHGAGLQMCADGSTYAGQFSYGLKHGFGIYTFRNGDVYAGEYFRDAMHGYGVYTFSNGQSYEGAWHDGCKQGLGRYTFRNGESLMGHWHLGALLTRCCDTSTASAAPSATATAVAGSVPSAPSADSAGSSESVFDAVSDSLLDCGSWSGSSSPLPPSAFSSVVSSPSLSAATSPSAMASPCGATAGQSPVNGRPLVDPAKVLAAVEAARRAKKRAETLSGSDESLSEVVAAANQAAATAREVAAEARALGPRPETKSDLQSSLHLPFPKRTILSHFAEPDAIFRRILTDPDRGAFVPSGSRQIQSILIRSLVMKLTDGMAALVTGAGSGIGRAASQFLAAKGLRVTVVDFSEAGGLETVRLIGEQTGRRDAARFVQCDVSKPSDLARAFAVHMQWCGRLDVCLNNAGIGEKEWFLKDTSADGKGSWRHVLDVNLRAVIDGTRLAVHAMQLSGKGSKGGPRGVIVNVASAAGLYPSPNGPIYAASKAGVVMFTRSLAHLAGSGIRINALCPEFIQTPLVTQITGQAAKHFPKVVASLGGFIPMETIMDGIAELMEDERRAGECMWITNRLGKQWWPTEEEKRRYLVAGTPGGGDSKGGDNKGSASKSDSRGGDASGGGGALALGAMPRARRGAGLGAAGGEASGKQRVGVASGLPLTFQKLVVQRLSSDFRQATSIIEAPLPLPVPAGKVLLRVRYAGVNASDVNYSAGRYAGSPAEASQQLPFDAGFEAVGEIVALPGSTTAGFLETRSKGGLAVGQAAAALAYGAFAEYMLVDARWVIPVPDCSPQMVALLTSGLTASIALSESGRMGSGETVLVTAAAGGTGQFAVQLAKLAGNRVVATCGSESKAAVLRELGADVVVNHRTEKDMAKALKKACGPQGAAVVFESVGGDMFAAALKALGRFGRLIVIGMMSQYTAGQEGQWVSKAYPGLCERLLSNSQTLVGFFLLHYPQLWRSHFTKLVTLYQAGLLKVALDPTPFKGLPAVTSAVEHLQSGSSVGKVVVEISPKMIFGKRKDDKGFDIEFSSDDISSIHTAHSSSGKFLDKYSLSDMEAMLQELGVMAKLRKRGHHAVNIELDLTDPFVHKMLWTTPAAPEPLCECALRILTSTSLLHVSVLASIDSYAVRPSEVIGEGAAVLKAWESGLGEYHPLKLLLVDWLLLQDPLAPCDETLLPGQHMPGLGVAIEFGNLLYRMAQEGEFDAVVNRPLHFHNAVMYAPTGNRFLNPQVEARFRVLVRDMEADVLAKSLADVSHTIQCAGLRLAIPTTTGGTNTTSSTTATSTTSTTSTTSMPDATSPVASSNSDATSPSSTLDTTSPRSHAVRVITWTAEEQANPVSDRMKAFLASDSYLSLVQRDSHGITTNEHLTRARSMLVNGRRVSLSSSGRELGNGGSGRELLGHGSRGSGREANGSIGRDANGSCGREGSCNGRDIGNNCSCPSLQNQQGNPSNADTDVDVLAAGAAPNRATPGSVQILSPPVGRTTPTGTGTVGRITPPPPGSLDGDVAVLAAANGVAPRGLLTPPVNGAIQGEVGVEGDMEGERRGGVDAGRGTEGGMEGQGEKEEEEVEEALRGFLPPPPREKCSEQLQAKFIRYLELKRAGRSINDALRNSKGYRNPDFMQQVVKHEGIDEHGSCFPKDVFNPLGFDRSDYYDALVAEQRREMERKEQERRQKGGQIEFQRGGTVVQLIAAPPKGTQPDSVAAAAAGGAVAVSGQPMAAAGVGAAVGAVAAGGAAAAAVGAGIVGSAPGVVRGGTVAAGGGEGLTRGGKRSKWDKVRIV